jgi:hypothetical protein
MFTIGRQKFITPTFKQITPTSERYHFDTREDAKEFYEDWKPKQDEIAEFCYLRECREDFILTIYKRKKKVGE